MMDSRTTTTTRIISHSQAVACGTDGCYYVYILLHEFVLRLDPCDLCVVRQLWLVINDVL